MLYQLIVAFCGHREVEEQEQVREWLEHTVETLLQRGATQFYLGGYGGFDRMAAAAVQCAKQGNRPAESILVLSYLDRNISTELYDSSVYPPLENVPKRFAIVRRNRWIVDHADIIVAYVLHDWGGAAEMLRYAVRRQKEIIRYRDGCAKIIV